jgi:hypothetical protein
MRLSSTLLALAAILAMTGTAHAANTTGTANATVVAAITIEEENQLNFGTIVPPSSGTGNAFSDGTAASGGVSQTGTVNPGTFTVTGDSSLTYNTTGSDPNVTLGNQTTGVGTIAADLTYTPGPGLAGDGTDTLTVNGNLAVPSTTTAGVYMGNYNVIVNYN